MTPSTPAHEVDILIVEDSQNDVQLAIRALKKHNLGNHVAVVNDGVAALDFLMATGAYVTRKEEPLPKVVFLDLKLPKVSGIEVLQQLRSNDRTRILPVVVMTASQEERDVAESYRLGVNSYVVKPIDFAQFAKVVADLGYYWVFTNRAPQ